MATTLFTRNVVVSGRRTSMRLEPAMWEALEEISRREGRTIHDLCTMINAARNESSLTAATRVFIVSYYRAAANEAEHRGEGYRLHAPRPLLDWHADGAAEDEVSDPYRTAANAS